MGKIKSVIDLSTYKIGESVWWVVLRPKQIGTLLPAGDTFLFNHSCDVGISTVDLGYKLAENHPKNGFIRSAVHKLPHLNWRDFNSITGLLNSDAIVEEFVVADIRRSNNTGEFLYMNQYGEWMPEIYLFDTVLAARNEKRRLLTQISSWTKSNA